MHLIGIAGPSGAGKTALARAVAERLGATVISLDSYYRDLPHLSYEERCGVNFDDPEALDHPLLCKHLGILASGGEVDVPMYDFTRHARRSTTERVRAAQFGVIEGLWTLYWPSVRASIATKVYVETCDATCYERRLARDVRERGRSAESVADQYRATVRPMAEQYIYPSRELADIVISGVARLGDSVERVCEAALAGC